MYEYLYEEIILFFHERVNSNYRQISNISAHQIPNLNVSCLFLQLSLLNPLKQVENEDVVGAALTGNAPSTSEWSTILLPSKVRQRSYIKDLTAILEGENITIMKSKEPFHESFFNRKSSVME